MPDKYGSQTLRDRFPITCDVCKRIIEPAVWKNEVMVKPDEGYFVIGMRQDRDGVPQNIYAHTEHMPERKIEKVKKIVFTSGNYCIYCGSETDNRFCCDACQVEHDRDMAQREPSEEVQELIRHLRELSASQKVEQERASGGHSSASASGNGNGVAHPRPAKDLSSIDAEKLSNFVPQNEMAVIFTFGRVIDRIGYRMAHMDGRYPDATLISHDKKLVRVEFEYQSSNFVTHGHDPAGCDLVICWELDRGLPLPVIALARHYNTQRDTWDFSDVGKFITGRSWSN